MFCFSVIIPLYNMYTSIVRADLVDDTHYYLNDLGALLDTSWAYGSTTEGPADILVGRDGGPAYLTGYFTLDRTNFRLDPVGGYDPECLPVADLAKGFTHAYSKAFGSVLLSPIPSRRSEFSEYSSNIRSLMDQVRPEPTERGFFADNNGEVNFVVRHRMFQERSTLGDPSDSQMDEPFRMINWPVPASCRKFHETISGTHKPAPIEAFVIGCNDLIRPSEYVSQLRGAVARVDFSLIHKVTVSFAPDGPSDDRVTRDVVRNSGSVVPSASGASSVQAISQRRRRFKEFKLYIRTRVAGANATV
ncbi:hypothetical protein FRC12_012126 [Ceratobasidium sp. 428]|nr:hypothetical protein FRC12_012126 [Ceratobasidium sp. 428]